LERQSQARRKLSRFTAIMVKAAPIFVNSMSDLFHEAVPAEFVKRVWRVMAETPWHSYQILTKRPVRMAEITSKLLVLNNMWLGTSVENADYLDRIDDLRRVPAAVRFISFEPLLGSVAGADLKDIHWAIVGGESGPRGIRGALREKGRGHHADGDQQNEEQDFASAAAKERFRKRVENERSSVLQMKPCGTETHFLHLSTFRALQSTCPDRLRNGTPRRRRLSGEASVPPRRSYRKPPRFRTGSRRACPPWVSKETVRFRRACANPSR